MSCLANHATLLYAGTCSSDNDADDWSECSEELTDGNETEGAAETTIPIIATKEDYVRDRINAFQSKLRLRCTMYICPSCGEEDEARKFMKTPLITSLDDLADYALEGNDHTFSTSDLLLRYKFLGKLQPILKLDVLEEDIAKVTSYSFVPYLSVR